MPSPITAGLHGLFLLVIACCQTSQDSNFDPVVQHVIYTAAGEENFQAEMQRQKRNVISFSLPPLEYTIDIEVSVMDSSFLEPIKEYFRNLSLPVTTNISNVEMTVSNINITTVCLPSGENTSCCSCENGHVWPNAECGDLTTCPSASPTSSQLCGYMKKMPFYGPYCEPQAEDICAVEEPTIMNMSVILHIEFEDDLRDPSSELYKNYKADLEKAFNASYKCLPGFVSATVTGFQRGSVLVMYEVKAGASGFKQIANANRLVPQYLHAKYQLDRASFTTEISNQKTFTVSPVDIFENDKVVLGCQVNTTCDNATWYHFDDIITNSSRFLVEDSCSLTKEKASSTVTITNITKKDSGPYRCFFTNTYQSGRLIYKARKTIAVSQLHITPNFEDVDVACSSPEMQAKGLLLSCCIDRPLPSLTGDWRVNGEIIITGVSSFSENCTEYKLSISESVCPLEKSGTVTTYTCELQTGSGARQSQSIRVTYLRTANVTISSSTYPSVSEGYSFNITCRSDVNHYDSVSWKIQSGNRTRIVDCVMCIENRKSPAMSVLTVKTATQDWSGSYICTFFQKSLASSASLHIDVIALPLKQNILVDPIEASILCKKQQALVCCINASATEDYNVKFIVPGNQVQAGEKREGNVLCYAYNYTETRCTPEEELTAYCKFINHKGQEVNSENITLKLISDKEVSCSDSLGIGKEEDTLIRACWEQNNADSFTRGNKTYRCSNKSWKIERDDCLLAPINNLLTSAESLVNSPEAKANLPTYLAELKEKTKQEQTTISESSANLDAIITILDMISTIPAEAEKHTIQNFLYTVDNIVADSTSEAWEDLNKEQTVKSSSLLQSVEKFSLYLQPVNNTIPPVFANTLQLQGTVVTGNSSTDYNKSFQSTENLTASVFIGGTDIQTLPPNSTIVSVMYSKLGHILPRNESQYVNSLLVTTTVSSNSSPAFSINMTFAKANLSLKYPLCVFWNFTFSKHGGSWDTAGCNVTEVEGDIMCSCNHLTSFSVLMSPDTSSQVIFEDYITYIGLAISILSLVVCIIIESLVWKYVTNNTTSYMRHVCILNIATSLLIADIWFIVTASINDQKKQISGGICFVATFFIHLFYLCVFFWMLSLGLILFYRLVFILHNTSKTAQKAVAFSLGYGCPFVIAVITIAVTLPGNSYTGKDICWLNWKDSKALLAFVVPALIIVAMNLFITAVVIIKILRPTIGDRSYKQERKSLFQIGKSVAILTPLLGLTWGFGFATMIKNSHRAFHILFALLNALQGLFILVFGTLWDKKIQEALLKRNSASKWSSQQTKSTSLILVTPMLAMSYPFSRTFNNLCGKTGKYRVSSSEPSSASSENTSKSYSLLN
ncbi:adhesion G protein-coupled receptor F5 [Porphyrio hochstetteri]